MSERKKGLSLVKKASSASVMKDIAVGTGALVGSTLALKGVTHIIDKINDKLDRKKYSKVIMYAEKKHPELKHVPLQQKYAWMDAFHTLAPDVAMNKELGATMLVTAHNYGNNIDLATAKMVADTGKSSIQAHGKNDFMQYIGYGSNIANSAKQSAKNAGAKIGQKPGLSSAGK